MIHINTDKLYFHLVTNQSIYTSAIDPEGRFLHVNWRTFPDRAFPQNLETFLPDIPNYECNMDKQLKSYEVVTYGDVTTHDTGLKVSFPEPFVCDEFDDPAIQTIRDLRLRYQSHEIIEDATPGLAHGDSLSEDPRQTLVVKLKDIQYDFWVNCYFRVDEPTNTIERWIQIENKTTYPLEIERCHFSCLNFAPASYELTRVDGGWAREFALKTVPLTPGILSMDSQSLVTGFQHNPFFLINETGKATSNTGVAYLGTLSYSGNWECTFKTTNIGTLRASGGYSHQDFAIQLKPGDEHTTPSMIMGISTKGHNGCSQQMHAYAQKYILPPINRETLRPVIYNSWYAVYFEVTAEKQMKMAQHAAAIGIELFCIDDGWFGNRHDCVAGLGDWFVRESAFPNGLNEVIDEVHRLGMKFGLWIEPEMVNPDSELYRQHPEWVLHYPGRERLEERNQLILDLSKPEVIDYLTNALQKLLETHNIDFLKWDMNRHPTETGSISGKSFSHQHTQAVYKIMDTIRAKHPTLTIESCSGGGGRCDYGILQRTDQVWTSDMTDPVLRTEIQEGFSYAYPARTMECWVPKHEDFITKRHTPLSFRFDVSMRGALGIGVDLSSLDKNELQAFEEYIAFYKEIRPTAQNGILHRLKCYDHEKISIWQFSQANGETAVYSEIHTDAKAGKLYSPPALKGLIKEAQYRLRDLKGTYSTTKTGFELMTFGLPPIEKIGENLEPLQSQTVFLEKC